MKEKNKTKQNKTKTKQNKTKKQNKKTKQNKKQNKTKQKTFIWLRNDDDSSVSDQKDILKYCKSFYHAHFLLFLFNSRSGLPGQFS